MLVAKIAEQELLKTIPEAFELAQNITSLLNQFSHGKINSFTESAVWADDVKTFKLNMMDPWHYIDVPLRLDDNDTHPHIPHSDNDCIALMSKAMKALSHWSKPEIANLSTNVFEKSLLLRYLVHVVGDVHQPLHAVELFDDVHFPKGDMGGNLFLIEYSANINNLHKFYDSGADMLPEFSRPLNSSSLLALNSIATNFTKEFPPNSTQVGNTTDFDEWVTEAFYLAKEFVYKNATYKANITEAYKKEAYQLIKHRIALGGYRLASLIEQIYSSYKKAKAVESNENEIVDVKSFLN